MAIPHQEALDKMLMEMLQQAEGGVSHLMDSFFSFLARKTDFFDEEFSTAAFKLTTERFLKYSAEALKVDEKEFLAEQEPSNRNPPTSEIGESKFQELADEETTEKLQEELNRKWEMETFSTKELVAKNKDEDGENGKDKDGLQMNSGNGSDFTYRCWTLPEIQLSRSVEDISAVSQIASMEQSLNIEKNPLLLSPVIHCVLKFLSIEDVKNCRLLCREWGKSGKLVLASRALISFHLLEPLRRPVDFQSCLLDSASLFSSYEISCDLTKKSVTNPWTIEELTKFFEEQQNNIRELSLMLESSDENILQNFDLSSCISKSPMVQKDTKYMTKLSIKCAKTMFDIPLNVLQHIKKITLISCRISLEEGIKTCPTIIELENVTFIDNGIELDRVRINDILDLRKAKEVCLKCYKGRGASTKYVLDVRGNTTLDKLILDNCEIMNGETSQWVIEHLETTDVPYSLNSQMEIKELSLWYAGSVDLFNLPTSIQKLALHGLGGPNILSCSHSIVFQNLQYLSININYWGADTDYSFLSHYKNCPQLTHLKLSACDEKEFKYLWMPNSVKTLTLRASINWTEVGYLILDKLITEFLSIEYHVDGIDKLCEANIPVDDFVINSCEWNEYEILEFLEYRKRFGFCKRIYIGELQYYEGFQFEDFLKEHVDVMSSCYVFEGGQKGRAISETAFWELIPKHL